MYLFSIPELERALYYGVGIHITAPQPARRLPTDDWETEWQWEVHPSAAPPPTTRVHPTHTRTLRHINIHNLWNPLSLN